MVRFTHPTSTSVRVSSGRGWRGSWRRLVDGWRPGLGGPANGVLRLQARGRKPWQGCHQTCPADTLRSVQAQIEGTTRLPRCQLPSEHGSRQRGSSERRLPRESHLPRGRSVRLPTNRVCRLGGRREDTEDQVGGFPETRRELRRRQRRQRRQKATTIPCGHQAAVTGRSGEDRVQPRLRRSKPGLERGAETAKCEKTEEAAGRVVHTLPRVRNDR